MKRLVINEDLVNALIGYLETQPLGQVKVLYSELGRLEDVKKGFMEKPKED